MSDRIIRYLRCDLDRVEERRFLEDVAQDSVLSTTLSQAYDAHVERERLLAFIPTAPELSDCFSLATLQSYADGQLDGEAQAIVSSHLACPLCGPQVDRLREAPAESETVKARSRFRGPQWRTRRPQIALVIAACAALLFLLWPSPPGQVPMFSIVGAHAEAQLHAAPGAAWDGAPVIVARGSQLKLRLEAGQALDAKVSVSLFFVGPEKTHRWSPEVEISKRSVTIYGEVPDALFLADAWSLFVGLSLSDEAPSITELRDLIESPNPQATTQVLLVPIEILNQR